MALSMIPLGPGPEFDRIRRIAAVIGADADRIGDDCAILPDGPGRLVVSTDLSVEGRHFRREWLSLAEVGWRAAAGALSDLAAEGATPVGVLVSLGIPPGATETDSAELMHGVAGAVHAAGGTVLGGDLSAASEWLVDVTVIGRAIRPVTRVGAQPGDRLWVSGTLGLARAALTRWRAGGAPGPLARRAFANPEPRIALGQALAQAGARAMIDLSDGLGGDARHLASASRVHLEITLDVLPLVDEVRAAADELGMPPRLFAAEGGEDYELLVAMPASFGDADARSLASKLALVLTPIGTVTAGEGVTFRLDSATVYPGGYDHFR